MSSSMPKTTSLTIALLLLFLIISPAAQAAGPNLTKKVPASDSGISYTGRTLAEGEGVSFDWVGTYLQTDFTGGSIAVDISDTGNNYFNIFIDEKLTRKIQVNSPTATRIILAQGLSSGFHRLKLQRCTEGSQGRTTIHGIYLTKNGRLAPVAPRKRLIEFIGDSYTCGYGTEAGSNERFKPETENCNQAYACMVARYFNADYVLIAHSGRGMSRNYGDSLMISPNNMVERYLRLFDEAPAPAYSFKVYRPDLVTINLGTNDYSTGKGPKPETFAAQYLKMIEQVRSHYGEVPILCIIAHSAGKPLKTSMAEVSRRVSDMKNVYVATEMPGIVSHATDMGADWHPNYQGQRKIAMTLIPRISQIMGWQLENKVVE